MEYVIGIDGGGTKTTAVLADSSGRIHAMSVSGPSNPNTVTEQELFRTLSNMMTDLEYQCPGLFRRVSGVFAGVSGTGSEPAAANVKRILVRILSENINIEVQPDSLNALYAGSFGRPGIVQIAGTGSITYGMNSLKETGRVGGWGYLIGDEGSGYAIGRDAVNKVLKAADGLEKSTILTEFFCHHFQVEYIQEIVSKIYQSPSAKSKISPLAKLVFEAYHRNDETAIQIVRHAGRELSNGIIALYKKLFTNQEQIPIILSGGMFSDKEVLIPIMEKELGNHTTNLSIKLPALPPVGGSVIAAFLQQTDRIEDVVVKRMIQEFKKISMKEIDPPCLT